MTDNRLTLFCLADGKAMSNAFSIKVPSIDTVADLKNLIKTEKSPEFDDVAADKLTLWDVSFLESIFLKDLHTARKLHPMEKICDVFKDPLAEKTVSIIVQRPSSRYPIHQHYCTM
ncbi:hypothetical protein BG005_000734 [Podila minutissima]|nr:hypothetical protein BG005_000734 [Podila minutissima]